MSEYDVILGLINDIKSKFILFKNELENNAIIGKLKKSRKYIDDAVNIFENSKINDIEIEFDKLIYKLESIDQRIDAGNYENIFRTIDANLPKGMELKNMKYLDSKKDRSLYFHKEEIGRISIIENDVNKIEIDINNQKKEFPIEYPLRVFPMISFIVLSYFY